MPHIDYPDHTSTWQELRRLAVAEGAQLARGMRPDLLSPLQRSMTAPTRPAEELYDISVDPHETRNLVEDPEYAPVLERLRGALDEWLERYDVLGAVPEEELLDRWVPGGVRRKTAAARIELAEGRIVATCATEGAAIAWTADPPSPRADTGPANPLAESIGSPAQDGRRWQLYTEPIEAPDAPIWVACFRIGFEPSDDVEVPAGAAVA